MDLGRGWRKQNKVWELPRHLDHEPWPGGAGPGPSSKSKLSVMASLERLCRYFPTSEHSPVKL